ncbi:hypothetical protein AAFF_G00247990 [Aldrovandia affinis]|uniref:MHC class I-like antigen recognition-like domain-containing protein n=1 Tax=Aldrovandia affinis TaxID=143900 RepID=A0AAD7RDH4_9TELE|nr:hypothetical protein AAFF_G00247990 [Aldrovandia affinis]
MPILIATILWTVSLSLSEAKETIIQYAHSGVFGTVDTTDILTINSVPIEWGDRRNNSFLSNIENETLRMIIKSFKHTTANRHTYQRTRKCRLEEFKILKVSDRIQYDGREYLSLDSFENTWTAAVPQALALKQQWDQGAEKHELNLRNGCMELIKAFTRNEHPVSKASFAIIVIIAIVAFLCLCVVIFYISKNGCGHPGGVLGSIIHYPRRGPAL